MGSRTRLREKHKRRGLRESQMWSSQNLRGCVIPRGTLTCDNTWSIANRRNSFKPSRSGCLLWFHYGHDWLNHLNLQPPPLPRLGWFHRFSSPHWSFWHNQTPSWVILIAYQVWSARSTMKNKDIPGTPRNSRVWTWPHSNQGWRLTKVLWHRWWEESTNQKSRPKYVAAKSQRVRAGQTATWTFCWASSLTFLPNS